MLLSAFLIVGTFQSDSWWRKLLHFIFIVSNNHYFFMSLVYNGGTVCCIMKFKALHRLEGSHTLFTYIYIYLCGDCFVFTPCQKPLWWMCGWASGQNWSVIRQLSQSSSLGNTLFQFNIILTARGESPKVCSENILNHGFYWNSPKLMIGCRQPKSRRLPQLCKINKHKYGCNSLRIC